MILYYVKAKVVIAVRGISGAFSQTVSKLVRARNTPEAKAKYEAVVRQMFAHMHGDSYAFEYLEIADEIQ